MKKKRSFDLYGERLFQNIVSAPRTIAYSNKQHNHDFNDCIRKYKNKIYFLFTVAPENLTLEKIGYNDTWSKDKLVGEQFEIEIDKKQAKQIVEKLTKILKRM